MGVYERLGLTPVLNADATLTALGGSVMAPEVVAAMADAARHFVDLDELQARAGARIAQLTRNSAAYITSGAAAGLVLATAACVTGMDAMAVALARLQALLEPAGYPAGSRSREARSLLEPLEGACLLVAPLHTRRIAVPLCLTDPCVRARDVTVLKSWLGSTMNTTR